MNFLNRSLTFLFLVSATAITACSAAKPLNDGTEAPKTIVYKARENKRLDGQSLERYFSSTLIIRELECKNIAQTGASAYRFRSEDTEIYSEQLIKCRALAKSEADEIFKELASSAQTENMQLASKGLYVSWNTLMALLSVYSTPQPAAELNFRNALEAYNAEMRLTEVLAK